MDEQVFLFALCSPDARFPNQKSWYLKVDFESRHQIAIFYESLKVSLDLRYGHNRHFFDISTGKPTFDLAPIFHPDKLSAEWIILALKYIDECCVVYISINGAMFPPTKGRFIEHSVKSLPVLDFPVTIDNEYIIITKWENGEHYYLESNIGRIFSKPYFNSKDDAYNEAIKFVQSKRISWDEKRIGRKITGD